MSSTAVTLQIHDRFVVIDNGILQLKLSKPDGNVTEVRYNGIDNLLEVLHEDDNGGYWDIVWDTPGGTNNTRKHELIKATEFKVIVESEEQVEVSFTRTWSSSLQNHMQLAPINIDKRFILLRGCSGFYCYGIYEHLGTTEWPAFSLNETRTAFKLRKDKFRYMAVADNLRRRMPLPEDRQPPRGKPLDYPEAVLLVDPVEPEFKGEVDDKYQYSLQNRDLRVHGWISTEKPSVGFWQITPSNEFRSGGPLKQELSSHLGATSPITLAMFHSEHYAGDVIVPKFKEGELWKKVFGPIFIYLNAVKDGQDPLTLWDDAKKQMLAEVKSWPYNFPASKDFQKANQRGTVRGRLLVRDRYVDKNGIIANGAFVGLAPPGEVGSWVTDGKGYQFWGQADEGGNFSIDNIRSGEYNLYAWVPGFIGDYRYNVAITITPGHYIDVGNLVYEPPRDGPTLWEIGVPNRSASELYIPDPNIEYNNKFLDNPQSKFRQYGLWERYSELYPHGDLVFKVGRSDYKKDWFFAQVSRKTGEETYEGTTWKIKFKLQNIQRDAAYKLRVALAAASFAQIQVHITNPDNQLPIFSSGEIGNDSAIARHGIHGLYRLFNIDIPSSKLVEGDNTIYLTQPRLSSAFNGIMYDYIRLEGPPNSKFDETL